MYVPVDADNPTWDRTVKVPLRRWLTSSGAERQEWFRLRQAAAHTQHLAWQAQDRERADRIARRIAGPQRSRRSKRPRRGRSGWLSFEVLLIAAPVLVFVAVSVGLTVWYSTR